MGHRSDLNDLMQILSGPLRLGSANMKKKVADEVDWLFDVYKQHTGHQPMCGGAQNLVLGRAQESNFNKPLAIDDLPDPLVVFILSMLSPADLCRVCQVSRRWLRISSDELVWRRILHIRSKRWLRIHDDKNPDFFRRVCPDLDSKQIYLKCHPHNAGSTSFRIPNFRQLLSVSRPRIIMFGPGLELEASESSIVRTILTDTFPDLRQRFEVTGMSAGEFRGVGSGISLRFGHNAFNLVTLYSNVKSVRQAASRQSNRVDENQLFIKEGQLTPMVAGNSQQMFEVSRSVQELCKKTAAFIYVVNASASAEQLSCCQPELFAMCCEMWSPSVSPLLVVGASKLGLEQPLAAIDIVRALRLGRLNNRKWMVQSSDVETMAGFRGGLEWLLTQIH